MKLKNYVLTISLLFLGLYTSHSQVQVPFATRLPGGSVKIKGDVTFVGNNIIGRTTTLPTLNAAGVVTNLPILTAQANANYNGGTANNDEVNFEYIDIDGDPTTFSSSSSELKIAATCKKIKYAGLYWSAFYPYERSVNPNSLVGTPRFLDFDHVKFKALATGAYQTLTADNIVYNGFNAANPNASFYGAPYVCYKDVTTILQALGDANGIYTVADMRAGKGRLGSGLCAGWSLVVVYESPTLPSRYISTFDGYAGIDSSIPPVDFNIAGFQTIPTGPVRATIGVGSLEGDVPYNGDNFQFKAGPPGPGAFTSVINGLNPAGNFFNSSITINNAQVVPPAWQRTPASTNTLGFDLDLVNINNPTNSVIPNGTTAASLRLTTGGDAYSVYLTTFAVDIIEPKIILTKVVQNETGTPIPNNAPVGLCQTLNYVLGYQNIGNDNATSFTIKDVLPVNVTFNYPADLTLPPGVTAAYNAGTRTLIFTIPNNQVEINDPRFEIRIKVKTVCECVALADACANEIKNQAYSTYSGQLNPLAIITNDPSLSSYDPLCNEGVAGTTNILVGLGNCAPLVKEVRLCTGSVVLTAANGYSSYNWYNVNPVTNPTALPIGTGQNFTATAVGTYYVQGTLPCLLLNESFVVKFANDLLTNPIIPYASEVAICPNDGEKLPYIFLCGAGASKLLETSITGTTSIIWEKLNEASCPPAPFASCANTNTNTTLCPWTQVGTGPSYTANASGQYRLILNFQGGCFRTFYFNVYKNVLSPTYVSSDIYCTTPGKIIINNVPAGYEYSLSGAAAFPWQIGNTFTPITVGGVYIANIRQIGAGPNACLFTVPNIQIRARDFTVSQIVTQPLCFGDKGKVILQANDVRGQYFFSINQGATVINSVGPIAASDYTFPNLTPGTYQTQVKTEDGCLYNGTVIISQPPLLTATSSLTKPLTCTAGEITAYPLGGTPPYNYSIDNGTTYQLGDPVFPITTAGAYIIKIVDYNNCVVNTTITVAQTAPPVFTITPTNISCVGAANAGTITVNVINSNGNTIAYILDNGTPQTSNVFSNVAVGPHTIIVQYTSGTSVCTSAPQTITITQPANALSATASVAQLAGCVVGGKAKVIISNPAGGTPAYSYSFDNGVTYGPLNEGLFDPGTYTVYIKDSLGCIFPMSITVAQILTPPTLTVANTTFNCNGSANVTATINSNGGSYSFAYSLDTILNTPPTSNVFTNVAAGNHTISVVYTNLTTPLPISCVGTVSTAFVVPSDKVFAAQIVTFKNVTCNGLTNGEITIAAQNFPAAGFQYSLTGATGPWLSSLTSPKVITGLPAGTTNILVRYDGSATTCTIPLTQVITAPNPLVASAIVTSPLSCINGAVLTATATGGSPVYLYELRNVTTGAITVPFQTNPVFSNVLAGTYNIVVKDVNGCIDSIDVPLVIATPGIVIANTTGSDLCFDANGANITVNASGGLLPYTYSLNGGIPQVGNSFNNLTPGTYTIIVKDALGCSVTLPVVTISNQLTLTAVLFKDLDCSALPNATITGTIGGGTAAFTVQVSTNGGTTFTTIPSTGTTFTYSNLTAGTYLFQVKDGKNCIAQTSTITINPLPPVTAITIVKPAICFGQSNGSLIIQPTNGTAPYTFNFNNLGFTNNGYYTGVAAGTYPYSVKDAKGCLFTGSVVIDQPTQIQATASVTTPFTCTGNATITVTSTSGGNPGYTYSIDGSSFQASPVFANLINGTYTIYVKDASDCLITLAPIVIAPLVPPSDMTFVASALSCPTNTSNVTITTVGGVAAFSYKILLPLPVVSQSSNVFNGLAPGTYLFEVTDSKNCSYQESYTIVPLPPLSVLGQVVNNIKCSGSASGNIRFTVTGTAAYSYTINAGVPVTGQTASVINITNQPAGNYTIVIKDNVTNCTATTSVIITAPPAPLAVTLTSTAIGCSTQGAINVVATGGWGGNTYVMTPPTGASVTQNNPNFTGLTANGIYTIVTTDSNGCLVTTTINLAAPVAPIATIGTTSLCFDNITPTSITINVTGGVAPYTYFNGTIGTTSPLLTYNYSGLSPATYNFKVVDALGCVSVLPAQTIAPQLVLSNVLTKPIDCSGTGTINSPSAAVITGIVSGGTAPYTYTVNTPPSSTTVVITPNASGYTYQALAGTYQIKVTDAKGCVALSNIIVIPIFESTISFTPTIKDVSCNGGNDGSISIAINSSINPSYTYSINNGPFVNTSSFTNLIAGTYIIKIKNALGCIEATTLQVNHPDPIIATALVTTPYTCSGNGTITVNPPTGGTPGYTYSIDGTNFQASPIFPNLTDGTYTITVKDSKGCLKTTSITIDPLVPPTNLTFTSTALSCAGANPNTSNVTISSVTGTYPSYLYRLLPTGIFQVSNVFPNLAPGTYTFEVKDAKNCTYQETYTINPIPPISVAGQVISNVKCLGSSTGSIRYTVSGTTAYSFTINAGAPVTGQTASVINITNQPAGTYTIIITDNVTFCTTTASVTVLPPTAVLAATVSTSPLNCLSPTSGQVVVNATGGWGGNTYVLSPPSGPIVTQNNNTFSGLSLAGSYTVTTTDSNGCSVSNTFTLTTPSNPTATIASTSDICYDAATKATLVVTAAGGVAPYTYQLIAPSPITGVAQVSNTFINLTPGTYTIKVKDALGCSVNVVQIIAPQLLLNASLTKQVDCTALPNGTITGSILGGTSSFVVQVSFNGNPFITIPSLPLSFTYSAVPGSYIFQVTDSKGCVDQTTPLIVAPAVPPQFAVTLADPILCNGSASGSINVNINSAFGVGPYVINVLNTTTGTSYGTNTSGLPAGNYTITVTDSKSCFVTQTITIAQPALITYEAIIIPIQCSAAGTLQGSIIVSGTSAGNADNISGGVGPYTYVLTDLTGGNPQVTYTTPTATGVPHTFPNLDFGIYEITVTDSNNCTIKKLNLQVSSPPSDLIINISTPTASCAAGGTIKVDVTALVAGGGPYYFAIYTNPLPPYPNVIYIPESPPGSRSATFTGLTPGFTYSIVVFDALTNCYYFKQAAAPVPTLSTLTSTVTPKNVACKGDANGSVSFTISNYNATTVNYQIYNGLSLAAIGAPGSLTGLTGATTTVSNFGVLAPGNYIIKFTEVNGLYAGCSSASASFTIAESATDLTVTAQILKNDNCNLNAGQISATASGGTPPYLYQILSNLVPPPTALSPGWTSNNTIYTESGDYIAYVLDVNGCVKFSTPLIQLISDPSPVISAAIANQCVADQGGFSVNVTLPNPGIAPYTYLIDGVATTTLVAPFTISNLNSGPHTFAIKDFNGCGNSIPLNIYLPIQVNASFTGLPTCASGNGTITVSASGGTNIATNYRYILYAADGITVLLPSQVANTFTSIAPGTYVVEVRDVITTCTKRVTITLADPVPVTFTLVPTGVSCFGGNNGTITVNLLASNTDIPYTYQIVSPFIGSINTSNVFTGLIAGSYDIKVTSSRGCALTQTIVVTQPVAAVSVTASITTPFACSGNTISPAIITAVGSNGTPPYTYSIDGTNYSTTATFPVLNPAANTSVTISIKDANGCPSSVLVPITRLVPLTVAVAKTTGITCVNDEIVTVTAAGGSGNYSYQLLPSGAVQAINVFNLPAPGSYTIRVTDTTTGCYVDTTPYVVAPFNLISVVATATTPVTCFGDANGAVSVNITGYTGAYTYTVFLSGVAVATKTNIVGNTTTNPLLISGLAAGSYTIEITETANPKCIEVSNNVVVGSPAAPVTVVVDSNINANCTTGAQVGVVASGGTPGYTYAFVTTNVAPIAGYTASSTATLNPITATTWYAFVKDSKGCVSAGLPITIATDPLPTVSLPTFTTDQCTSTGNSYTFTATGTGLAPLTYSIGSGFQSGGSFTVSTSGLYTVTIKDKNGCTATAQITIHPPLVVNPTTAPTCSGTNATITVAVTGGTAAVANFEYTLTPTAPAGASVVHTAGSAAANIFTNVTPGIYDVTVKDIITGCTKTSAITIGAQIVTTFTTATTPVSCNGGTNGTLTVTLDFPNIDGPYSYQLVAPGPIRPIQTNNVFTGLAAASYYVKVTSALGCTTTSTAVVISQPTLLVLGTPTITPFACSQPANAINTATLTIPVPTTGTAPYTFSIDGTNYTTTNTFTILNTGVVQNITYSIKDANGCLVTSATPFVVQPLLPFTAAINQTTTITCTNGELIAVIPKINNIAVPVANYNYQLLPSGAVQVSNVFNLPTPGSYTIRVTNIATGCYIDTAPYVVAPFNLINVVATATTPVTCYFDNNGAVSVNISGYTGAYSYKVIGSSPLVSGSGNTATNPLLISGLASGSFTVEITETQTPFCVKSSGSVVVDAPSQPLVITVAKTADVTCSNNLGAITATASGGWNILYLYKLSGTVTTPYLQNPVFGNLPAGTYTVTVKDAKGCTALASITLSLPTAISAGLTATTLLCKDDATASVEVINITGGQGSNYNFTLNQITPTGTISGPITSTPYKFNNLGSGTYSVTVKDGWNCSFTTPQVTIANPTKVIASLVKASTATCLISATVKLTASGGTGPYTYSVDGTSFLPTTFASTVTIPAIPGTFHYYVQDAKGCISLVSNDIDILAVPALDIILDLNNAVVKCQGSSTASILATAVGGYSGLYSYTLLNGTTNLPIGLSNITGSFVNLPAGTYKVKVDSGDCTFTSLAITVSEPLTPLVIASSAKTDITCTTENDGTITVVGNGGTGLIQYSLTGPSTTPIVSPNNAQYENVGIFTDLSDGYYNVNVVDANGCFNNVPFQIKRPLVITPTLITGSVVNELCVGDASGAFNINITGGTPPFSVSLDNATGTYTTGILGQTQFNFPGLSGGSHTVYIKDVNGCTADFTQVLSLPVLINPTINPTNGIVYTCTANVPNNTVTVSVDASVSAPGLVSYSLDNSLNGYVANNVFSNVPVGNHTIYAKHTNGCIKPVTFTIEDRKPITAVISHIDVLCKSGTDGKITLSNISGGFGTFEYAVSPSTTFIPFTGNTVTITGLSAQSYTILIRNTGTVGTCSISLTDTIGEPTLLTTALANPTDPVSCYGSSDASFDVSFAGGTAPYKVKLNNSSYVNANNLSGANTHLFSGLAAGNYTVTVQDAHLCTVPVTLIIASGVLFDPVAVVTTLCVNDVTTNKVVIETNSPSPLSEFLFSVDLLPLQLSNVFGPLTAGPHSFKVTHQDGCVKTGVFVMSAISQVALSLADGGLNEIIATASGGSGGYTYTLNGVYYGNQNTFIISQTGAYTVVVTDSNGCTAKVANFNKVFIDIFIPNFFTPDGQGNNNVWGPTNTSNYPNMVTYIFDRYGRKVATLKEGEFWNGKYDGIELPTGDYWYVVKLQGDSDSREFVGNFTLYR